VLRPIYDSLPMRQPHAICGEDECTSTQFRKEVHCKPLHTPYFANRVCLKCHCVTSGSGSKYRQADAPWLEECLKLLESTADDDPLSDRPFSDIESVDSGGS